MKKALFVGLLAAGVVAGGILLARTVAADDPPLGRSWFRGWGGGKGLEKKAEMLGMTVEELEAELETKTMVEIFEDQGIVPEELQAQMLEKARGRWQEMGLSEEEIAEREGRMEERRTKRCEMCQWHCRLGSEEE